MYKTHHSRSTLEVEMLKNVHAVLARSTFGSEHVKNTRGSDHLLTIRLPFAVEKVHAVVAQIWKSNVSKTEGFKPIYFEVSDVVVSTDRWI